MTIDDNFISDYFYNNGKLNFHKMKNIPQDILSYLENRYKDSDSLKETIFRIKYKYEDKPICPVCGNKVAFNGHSKSEPWFQTCGSQQCKTKYAQIKREHFYQDNYGVKCGFLVKEIKEKKQKTFIDKYGFDSPAKNEKIRQKVEEIWRAKSEQELKEIEEKRKSTNNKKYGSDNVYSSQYGKDKIKETNQKRYNVDNPLQDLEIKKKAEQTIKERYGEPNIFLIDSVQKDIQLTKISNYFGIDKNNINQEDIHGFLSIMQSEIMGSQEVQEKIRKTKEANKTFSYSGIEKKFRDYLEKYFKDDYCMQFRSEKYPFNCDFYIKSLDLYIEIQGYWTHGKHPFDNNDEKDLEKLEKWKSKSKETYETAIKVWTISDPLKREIAKRNEINYLEIFECDIDKCIQEFEQYIERNL